MAKGSEEANMLMAQFDVTGIANSVWLIDSGRSFHMTRKKELLEI